MRGRQNMPFRDEGPAAKEAQLRLAAAGDLVGKMYCSYNGKLGVVCVFSHLVSQRRYPGPPVQGGVYSANDPLIQNYCIVLGKLSFIRCTC